MLRLALPLAALSLFLTACGDISITPNSGGAPGPGPDPIASGPGGTFTEEQAQRAFVAVKARVEPVAERECRSRTQGKNCDFQIVIDDRPDQPPNAFQTLSRDRRPIIVFTQSLLEGARNTDEIAFVMSHEAAHHIRGHLDRQRENAASAAVIFAGVATIAGGDAQSVQSAAELGGRVGARTYSKEYELEADALGTVLTHLSGYDPLLGAQYFNRIPDPGNRFLGTHPPNAQRLAIVRKTAASL